MYQLVFVFYFFSVGFTSANIVYTKSGAVEGSIIEVVSGHTYYSYTGISYAKAPVGELRFQPPVPIEPWNDTFNATETPGKCPQILDGTDTYDGDEDCLFLNVFTPQNAKPGDKIPVIVVFFGGIFKFGSTGKFGTQYFMQRRIIIVTVSFRLGVLGLFSTGDTQISGNMAFKDQTLALKWIQDNIEAFGGDYNRVTVMGHSSGGTSVHLHTLSPLSKGLFHRAIMQSGVANAVHCFHDKETAKSLSQLLSRQVGCGSNLTTEAIACLRNKSAEELVTTANDLFLWHNFYPSTIFRPTAEDKNVKGAFLTEVPVLATHPSTDIQMMTGITSGEGAYIANQILSNPEGLDMDPKLTFPFIAYHLWTSKPNHINFMSQSIKTHFFGEQNVGPETDRSLVQAITGILYGSPLIDAVDKFNGTKYVYYFNYRMNYTTQFDNSTYNKYLGIAHADELSLLFYSSESINGGLTDTDKAFSKEMITRWINFAYTGNPNEPEPINTTIFGFWEPVQSHNLEFMNMNVNGRMQSNYLREKFKFWQTLPIFSDYY